MLSWFRGAIAALMARRRLMIALQLLFLAALVVFLVFELRSTWHDAYPKLRHAKLGWVAASAGAVAAYYLVFIFGWQTILRQFGKPLPYLPALRSEMVSLLAKYIPGGVWTPAARVVAMRRYGIDDTAMVLAAMALEAGMSAIGGVLVLLIGLIFVSSTASTIIPVTLFAIALLILIHPAVYRVWSARIVRIFGIEHPPPALSVRATLGLLAFYSGTWIVGGFGFWCLVRSVAHPPVSSIIYLGGATAVGAIVAVLVVIAPSGLGVREASTYAFVIAVAPHDAALGAVVLNRFVITVVEAILLAGAAAWPGSKEPELPLEPEPEPSG
jgi:uncharacterized membrane protein YbhN (UPF0104 family)